MKSYGKTIKEIRLSKGILLKGLADKQLSMSLLSQFENEKSTISCERFHHLLSKLQVTLDEFILMQNWEYFFCFTIGDYRIYGIYVYRNNPRLDKVRRTV
ncbi:MULTISPECIES: helix-turn-helix domain-containing protein [Enterococcus]|uniref:helix-turn-helix domain-containing protein n=1 Tax=Enterococcus TaxID=1350 RepID=UPI00321938FF